MANISVRKIDERVYSLLQQRAKMDGLSMEEEVRQIITEFVTPEKSIVSIFRAAFSEGAADGFKLPEHGPHEPIEARA